jgi:general secretion pathway protein N
MARRPVPDRTAPQAPVAKRKFGWLIALGVLAALAFAVATLPAAVLSGYLERAGFSATSLSGSVWSGRADGLAWRGAPLGDAHWRVSAAPLLLGRISGDVNLVRTDGSATSGVVGTLGGELRFDAMHVDLPVEALGALPIGLPKGWRGRVAAEVDELVLQDGWPTVLRGTLVMHDLVAPPPRNAPVGSFDVVMPDPQGPSGSADTLTGRVSDRNGPFAVDARLTLSRDHSFLLDGTLVPRGPVAPGLERSLQLLGPADSSGRRPFSVSGTF